MTAYIVISSPFPTCEQRQQWYLLLIPLDLCWYLTSSVTHLLHLQLMFCTCIAVHVSASNSPSDVQLAYRLYRLPHRIVIDEAEEALFLHHLFLSHNGHVFVSISASLCMCVKVLLVFKLNKQQWQQWLTEFQLVAAKSQFQLAPHKSAHATHQHRFSFHKISSSSFITQSTHHSPSQFSQPPLHDQNFKKI